MGRLYIHPLLCSPKLPPKVCLPFPSQLSPGVDQLVLEQQEKRPSQMTEERGQAKGEEEPGLVVLVAKFINALKEN